VAPDSDALGKSFGMEIIAILAYSPEVRLNAKNQGVTLFELAPREVLTQSLRTLGERLAKRSESLAKPKSWFSRLRGVQ
jgi:pilus assembly protein CpaE